MKKCSYGYKNKIFGEGSPKWDDFLLIELSKGYYLHSRVEEENGEILSDYKELCFVP
jgi:hypothetical protein